MKQNLFNLTMGMLLAGGMMACQSTQQNLTLEHQGDSLTVIRIKNAPKYLILPIQENSDEGKVKL